MLLSIVGPLHTVCSHTVSYLEHWHTHCLSALPALRQKHQARPGQAKPSAV